MIRSLYSAVSGLRGHQTMLDVIGNNIANVNTASFKSSRVIFSDLYYQTLSAATSPAGATGGTNPTQIGYGALVSSIDVINTRSSFQQTSRGLDLYISGEGYFTVKDTSGAQLYTRLGAFSFDAEGNLRDSSGNSVLNTTGAEIQVAGIDTYTGISIDSTGSISGTNATGTIVPLGQIGISIFPNSNGLAQIGTSYFTETVNSGAPTLAAAGSAVAGSLVSGGLEMSNVDLSKEFTDMIVAQRGFQANARVITTSDQVLEELVNLKR